jgi:hypothetical protein
MMRNMKKPDYVEYYTQKKIKYHHHNKELRKEKNNLKRKIVIIFESRIKLNGCKTCTNWLRKMMKMKKKLKKK